MSKVKERVASRKRRKRVLKTAKGYRGGRRTLYRTAQETVLRAMAYSYRDRKVRKRDMRGLWIARINAACKEYGVKYSEFMDGLKKAKVSLDRKVLAELCVSEKTVFKKLIDFVSSKKKAKA